MEYDDEDQARRGYQDRSRRGSVSKADIMDIVQKAIAPLQEENARLRKTVEKQTDVLRKKDYVELAKSQLDELGTPEEGAEILKSLETLPADARKLSSRHSSRPTP